MNLHTAAFPICIYTHEQTTLSPFCLLHVHDLRSHFDAGVSTIEEIVVVLFVRISETIPHFSRLVVPIRQDQNVGRIARLPLPKRVLRPDAVAS